MNTQHTRDTYNKNISNVNPSGMHGHCDYSPKTTVDLEEVQTTIREYKTSYTLESYVIHRSFPQVVDLDIEIVDVMVVERDKKLFSLIFNIPKDNKSENVII